MSLTDKINPVALKELRQMVRSRTMIISIVAFLLLEVVISLLIVAVNAARYDSHSGNYNIYTGSAVFAGNIALLAAVVLFLIPILTFARVVKERGGNGQADLQFATAMKPSAFLNGKLFCSFALILMFVCATLPILSLSYLMRGVAISDICVFLVGFVALAFLENLVLVVWGACEIPVALKWLVVLCGGFFFGIGFLVVTVVDGWGGGSNFSTIAMFLQSGILYAIAVAMMWALGVAAFSSGVSNKFKTFKITYLICEVVALAVVLCGLFGDLPHDIIGWGMVTIICSCLVALLMSGCKAGLSRRVRREVSKSKVPRIFLYFITTGAENGILLAFFVALCGLAAIIIGDHILPSLLHLGDQIIVLSFTLYFFGYLMLARGIWLKISRHRVIPSILVPICAIVLQGLVFVFSLGITNGYEGDVVVPFDSFGVLGHGSNAIEANLAECLLYSSILLVAGVLAIGKDWIAGFRKKELCE